MLVPYVLNFLDVEGLITVAENAAGGLPVGLAGGKAGLMLAFVQGFELAQQIAVVKAAQLILLYVLFHVDHLISLKFLFYFLLLPSGSPKRPVRRCQRKTWQLALSPQAAHRFNSDVNTIHISN